MSTGLVAGLSLQRAADIVAERAQQALKPGMEISVWTETGRSSVLVGIARPCGAVAVAIDKCDYDGLKLIELINGTFGDPEDLPATKTRKA